MNWDWCLKQLNQGGLTIMSPSMLLYLRKLIETKKNGQYMIEVAHANIENDSDFHSTFIRCIIILALIHLSQLSIKYIELARKKFHARVNEYMTAAVEIDLGSGKAVKVVLGCLNIHIL